ncbi:MAG: DUF6624 domain-containing protein [Actinomadura sp.]
MAPCSACGRLTRSATALLSALREAVAAGDAAPRNLACLEDRCRINAGQPQIYGTQVVGHSDGELVPAELEDAARVDERRAAVGLGPIAEYLRHIRERNR